MLVKTSRFGNVEIEPEDILLFPHGMAAYEDLRHWVLLNDRENESIGWLQSVARPDAAFAVVSPRRFVPGYRIHVKRSQIAPLELADEHAAFVLAVLNRVEGNVTVNLRAPVIINLDRRIGRQIVTSDEQPLRHVLDDAPAAIFLRAA